MDVKHIILIKHSIMNNNNKKKCPNKLKKKNK